MTKHSEQGAHAPLYTWLALLPVFYPLSLLAVSALRHLRQFPSATLQLLAFYALTQQIAALLSLAPLEASLLALLRTVLIFSFLGVGIRLRQMAAVPWIIVGLGLLQLTALAYTFLQGADFRIVRLLHPYATSITLGLSGAASIWLAWFTAGRLSWRLPLGLLGLLTLLLSGSRGALLATCVGFIAGVVTASRHSRAWQQAAFLAGGMALLSLGITLGIQQNTDAISRLARTDTAGRQLIWENARTVLHAAPAGGVGSYRLGQYLRPASDVCELFTKKDGTAQPCPAWLDRLGSPWLIAHNALLQQWAETGPIGTLGFLLLLGTILLATMINRDPLAVAITAGFLSANLTDNTLLLPSPFFAELFWIVSGIALFNAGPSLSRMPARVVMVTTMLLALLAFPFLASFLLRDKTAQPPQLHILHAPPTAREAIPYEMVAKLDLPAGRTTLALQSCQVMCKTVTSAELIIGQPETKRVKLVGKLQNLSAQELRLVTIRDSSLFRANVWNLASWSVKLQE